MFTALNISLESVGLNFSPNYYGTKALLLNRSVLDICIWAMSCICALERANLSLACGSRRSFAASANANPALMKCHSKLYKSLVGVCLSTTRKACERLAPQLRILLL